MTHCAKLDIVRLLYRRESWVQYHFFGSLWENGERRITSVALKTLLYLVSILEPVACWHWFDCLIWFTTFSARLCASSQFVVLSNWTVTIFSSNCSFAGSKRSPGISIYISPMSKPQPVAVSTPTENEKVYEEEHVHSVYQTIASHFSDTRYKVWIHIALASGMRSGNSWRTISSNHSLGQ
jgi:hypothetical protein